jgi:tRNA nucleotidyltransferase (CCA-adding enzyme)
MKMYEVGGCVRDEILGVPSKDIDFTVVLDESEVAMGRANGFDAFGIMVRELKHMEFKIFLETPEYLTVRAKFPKDHERSNLTADFVLARKESGYADGRRPDVVEPGTLEDDLRRRDFTMNAIAKDADGTYIDPFNGVQDIEHKIIRAVGIAGDRLREDALRAVRALRFSVTKGFSIDGELHDAMHHQKVLDAIVNKISDERIQVELSKMFRFDTVESMKILSRYRPLTEAMFAGSVSLDATMKTKGRGK